MSLVRRISRTVVTAPATPGFIGEGHTAVEVVYSTDLPATDPFVLLMDDRLDLASRRQIGGPHPHAGLETVTLILEGTLSDREEGELSAGDAVWMNAGSGIVHNEHVVAGGRVRVLQLWIRLSASERSLPPSFEVISSRTLPVRREPGVVARLYSGETGDLRSPTRNRAPITLVDIDLAAGASIVQVLPASYNGFVYVLDGEVDIEGTALRAGEVGWLDRPDAAGASSLTARGGPTEAHFVLYAGAPQNEPLVHHGPFVGGSATEIQDQYLRYRAGRFESMAALARRARDDRRASGSRGERTAT